VRTRRATPVVSAATFVAATLVTTLVLGNALAADSCGAGWTGYVPIGSCAKAFWSAAFYIGPLIGVLVGTCAALLTQRAARRTHTGAD
jgi:heme/copper-type cytochrome/quinol oxidase subunit 1